MNSQLIFHNDFVLTWIYETEIFHETQISEMDTLNTLKGTIGTPWRRYRCTEI